MRRALLAASCWVALCSVGHAQMLQTIVNAKAAGGGSHSIAFTTLASGPISSTVVGSGTYTGTAPSSISSATWGGASCTGSSTVTGFTNNSGSGIWNATFSTPSSACTGTIAIIDDLTDSVTSPTVAAGFPGDVVSGAAFFGGLSAYNSTVAVTGTQKSILLTKVINSVACDVLLTNKGDLGLTSATCNSSTQGGLTPAAFAGTDATGNATSAGTAVAMTGLSSAAHAGDPIAGTGFIGSYCVSVGSLIAGAQTCTTNTSQSIGVSEPVTLTNALQCTALYGQDGNGNNATVAFPPYFISTGGTSSSKGYCAGDGTTGFNVTLSGAVSQPVSASVVFLRRSGTASQSVFANTAANFTGLYYTTANTILIYAGVGNTAGVTETDGVWHALQAVINGPSSSIMVDGSLTSSLVTGALSLQTTVGIMIPFATNSGGVVGGMEQIGIWPSPGISSANQSLINAIQHARGGF